MSQTQLSNIASVVGMLVIVAQQFGYVIDPNKTTFLVAAAWTLVWQAYNFYNRYKKGDLNLAGVRK